MNRAIAFCFILALVILGLIPSRVVYSREWTEASGKYKWEGKLLVRNETSIVLEKKDKSLVIVEISQLSEADKKYLTSKQAADAKEDVTRQKNTWLLRGNVRANGVVVEYCRRIVTVQRRRGKVYVNDRPYADLPKAYREMVLWMVAHFEKEDIADEKALRQWLIKQKGAPRHFTCDGVLMELQNGELYCVPFFLFSQKDQKLLKPGWEEWYAVKKDAKAREELSLILRTKAEADERQREESRQMARLSLQLQAVEAGLTDIWEVEMVPPANVRGISVWVVVPGRDSRQAVATARAKYPNYIVGSVVRVNRN